MAYGPRLAGQDAYFNVALKLDFVPKRKSPGHAARAIRNEPGMRDQILR
jgi:hypothetical protein